MENEQTKRDHLFEEMVAALEFFADADSWKLNGQCDPNSGNFTGERVAKDILAKVREAGQ